MSLTAEKTETSVVGRVARVTGPVVDIEFPHDSIPDIYNALKTTITIDGESTEITLDLLSRANGAKFYDRHVIPGYGHIDCIFGKDAARDVYPLVLEHLEVTA